MSKWLVSSYIIITVHVVIKNKPISGDKTLTMKSMPVKVGYLLLLLEIEQDNSHQNRAYCMDYK